MSEYADFLDQAADLEERHRDYAIKSIRLRKPVAHTGHCLWCNAEIPSKQLYCDADCKHDHEMEERVKIFTGLR